MKKVNIRLLKIISFLFLVFLMDRSAGLILDYFYRTSTNDAIAKIRYSLYQTNEDILVFGSSKALHQYIPDTLSKGTGYTAYNCGLGGQPIAFSLIQISETLKRYKPKIIILDIPPDISRARDSDPRLKTLNPFYHDNPLVKRILLNNDTKFEKLKFTSAIYPYNGMIAEILLSLVYDPGVSIKGFIPIYGSTLEGGESINEEQELINEIPAKQMEYLEEIARLCRDHSAVCWIIISPVYKTTHQELATIKDLKDFAGKNSIRFLDFSECEDFSDYLLFRDNLHLNIDGAAKFSGMVRDSIFATSRMTTDLMSDRSSFAR